VAAPVSSVVLIIILTIAGGSMYYQLTESDGHGISWPASFLPREPIMSLPHAGRDVPRDDQRFEPTPLTVFQEFLE